MARYNVIKIADAILRIAKKKNKELTPLQLMKLVYIAHGFNLAINGSALFDERIEAWRYGPVIPDLYRAAKHFGRNQIPSEQVADEHPNVDEETYAFLEDVFEKYGHLSGFALSSLTHKDGAPWDQVYVDGQLNVQIPNSIIKKHYEGMLDGR